MSSIFGGGGGSSTTYGPAFHVNKGGTNQTGVVSGADTLVTFSTEVFDTDGCFASNAFTPTTAGKYFIGGRIEFGGATDQTTIALLLYKNGALHIRLSLHKASGAGGQGAEAGVLVEANGVDDDFQLYALHGAGSDQTISGTASQTFFYGYFVRT